MENLRNICIRIMQISKGDIGNLRLQKLLYFVQAYCLLEFSEPAFREKIEAWTYGPVVSEAYYDYKKGWIKPSTKIAALDIRVEQAIQDIVEIFSDWSAYDLVNLTHEYQLWKEKVKGAFTDKEMRPSEILNFHENHLVKTGRAF